MHRFSRYTGLYHQVFLYFILIKFLDYLSYIFLYKHLHWRRYQFLIHVLDKLAIILSIDLLDLYTCKLFIIFNVPFFHVWTPYPYAFDCFHSPIYESPWIPNEILLVWRINIKNYPSIHQTRASIHYPIHHHIFLHYSTYKYLSHLVYL